MKPESVIPGFTVDGDPIVSDISVSDWIAAEESLDLNTKQPEGSVTVAQYADLRRFNKGPLRARRQKAYRILEALVEAGKAVKLRNRRPQCYRLRTPGEIHHESTEQKS